MTTAVPSMRETRPQEKQGAAHELARLRRQADILAGTARPGSAQEAAAEETLRYLEALKAAHQRLDLDATLSLAIWTVETLERGRERERAAHAARARRHAKGIFGAVERIFRTHPPEEWGDWTAVQCWAWITLHEDLAIGDFQVFIDAGRIVQIDGRGRRREIGFNGFRRYVTDARCAVTALLRS